MRRGSLGAEITFVEELAVVVLLALYSRTSRLPWSDEHFQRRKLCLSICRMIFGLLPQSNGASTGLLHGLARRCRRLLAWRGTHAASQVIEDA